MDSKYTINTEKPLTILVIPDSHAHPKHDNERMLWLGRYIMDVRPDIILHIGDMADMPSLSSYDFGTARAWGRFYRADIEATLEHQDLLFQPLSEYNERRRENKKAQWKPIWVYIKGNHEERADRFVSRNPQFIGFVDIDKDLKLDEYWDYVCPFGEEFFINGMGFTHYYRTATGKAVSGVVPARSMLLKKARSVVQGHNHKFSVFFQDRGHGQPKAQAYSVGYYGHPDQRENWNMQEQAAWDFGVLVLYDVMDGMATGGHRWITQEALERKYARTDSDE